MININEIPGFEETPDKIESLNDLEKIFKLADMDCRSNEFYHIGKGIKKLLDDRRVLAEKLFVICYNMEKCKGHKLESAITLLEKILGLTWEELQG
jgi:hypothetical protein